MAVLERFWKPFDASELESVFRREENATFTSPKNNFSSATFTGGVLRGFKKITVESILGTG